MNRLLTQFSIEITVNKQLFFSGASDFDIANHMIGNIRQPAEIITEIGTCDADLWMFLRQILPIDEIAINYMSSIWCPISYSKCDIYYEYLWDNPRDTAKVVAPLILIIFKTSVGMAIDHNNLIINLIHTTTPWFIKWMTSNQSAWVAFLVWFI